MAEYGPGSNIRGGRSGMGGKAPVTAASVYKKKGVTPTSDTAASDAATKAYNDTLARLKAEAAASAGGGGDGPSALDRYTRQLQGMLTSGSYAQPYNDLQSKLGELYGQATPKINEAMGGLQSFLQGQTNPYAGFQAQQTQVTPQLSELLGSQGVSQTPLQQLAATTQAQNAGQATAFNNLVGSLGQIWGANHATQLQDAQAQQANLASELEQSRLGMGAQIAEKNRAQQQNLITMLLSALSKGGRPNAGRLF